MRNAMAYTRSFQGEIFIAHAFVVFWRTLAVHRTRSADVDVLSFLYLLCAKLYCVHHTEDTFTAQRVKRFSNNLLWRSRSIRSVIKALRLLSERGYINPVRIDHRGTTHYALSMKAIALCKELEVEFRRPFVIDSPYPQK
jgi:hypothetical protein